MYSWRPNDADTGKRLAYFFEFFKIPEAEFHDPAWLDDCSPYFWQYYVAIGTQDVIASPEDLRAHGLEVGKGSSDQVLHTLGIDRQISIDLVLSYLW